MGVVHKLSRRRAPRFASRRRSWWAASAVSHPRVARRLGGAPAGSDGGRL